MRRMNSIGEDALPRMESVRDFRHGPLPSWQTHGGDRVGGLSHKVKCVTGVSQRHVPADYTSPRESVRLGRAGVCECFRIDEALPAGVYSAEPFSSIAAPSRREKLSAPSPCVRNPTRRDAPTGSVQLDLARCSATT